MFNAWWGPARFAAVCRAERDAALLEAIFAAVSLEPGGARVQ